jgi:hypothetical protein
MKLLTILCGIGGFYYGFIEIFNMDLLYVSVPNLFAQIFSLRGYFRLVIGMIISSLTILVATKPNDPLPWHWGVLVIFGGFLLFFSYYLCGIGVIAAGVLGRWKKI